MQPESPDWQGIQRSAMLVVAPLVLVVVCLEVVVVCFVVLVEIGALVVVDRFVVVG